MMDLLYCLLGFLITFVAMPGVMALAKGIGAMDVPRDFRRMHSKAVPRAGGIALFGGFLCSVAAWGMPSARLACVLGGGILMLLLGLADDIFCLGAIGKLISQISIATAAVLGWGVKEGIGCVLAVLWVVTLTNAHNFIDGLDGLLAGCGAIEGGLSACACLLWGAGEQVIPLLCLSAACLGFRCYNRFPARIFAGDCGSATVGFLLGMLTLPLFRAELGVGLLAPLFLFAYPLTDLFCAVLRRTMGGKSPFAADRAHLHHRLSAAGLSQTQCVKVLLSICAALGGIGVLTGGEELLWGASFACAGAAVLLMRLRRWIFRAV